MPGPRKFKATKLGVILDKGIPQECLQEMFSFLDNLYIKYEVMEGKTDEDFISYSALAKRRGLEAVIVAAKVSSLLPALCAKVCLVPLVFAPFSAKTKTVPAKRLSAAPFAAVAVDKPLFAAIYAARIIAIRDKSLARRLLNINFV